MEAYKHRTKVNSSVASVKQITVREHLVLLANVHSMCILFHFEVDLNYSTEMQKHREVDQQLSNTFHVCRPFSFVPRARLAIRHLIAAWEQGCRPLANWHTWLLYYAGSLLCKDFFLKTVQYLCMAFSFPYQDSLCPLSSSRLCLKFGFSLLRFERLQSTLLYSCTMVQFLFHVLFFFFVDWFNLWLLWEYISRPVHIHIYIYISSHKNATKSKMLVPLSCACHMI